MILDIEKYRENNKLDCIAVPSLLSLSSRITGTFLRPKNLYVTADKSIIHESIANIKQRLLLFNNFSGYYNLTTDLWPLQSVYLVPIECGEKTYPIFLADAPNTIDDKRDVISVLDTKNFKELKIMDMLHTLKHLATKDIDHGYTSCAARFINMCSKYPKDIPSWFIYSVDRIPRSNSVLNYRSQRSVYQECMPEHVISFSYLRANASKPDFEPYIFKDKHKMYIVSLNKYFTPAGKFMFKHIG